MKYSVLALLFCCISVFCACEQRKPLPHDFKDTLSHTILTSAKIDTTVVSIEAYPEMADRVIGHFKKSDLLDTIYLTQTKTSGEDADDGPEYGFVMAGDTITDIGCCGGSLINEGDLNGDGVDEFTFFREPLHGCMWMVETYTYRNGKYDKLFQPFGFETACEPVNTQQKQAMVEKKNGTIYFAEQDLNDDNFKVTMKAAKLKMN